MRFHALSNFRAEDKIMKTRILILLVLFTASGCGDNYDSRLTDADVAYLKARQYGYAYSSATATATVTSTETYTATETVTTTTITTTE